MTGTSLYDVTILLTSVIHALLEDSRADYFMKPRPLAV
jgi:hypothetical protein